MTVQDPSLLYRLRKLVSRDTVSAMAQNLIFTEDYIDCFMKDLVDDEETRVVAQNVAEAYNSSDMIYKQKKNVPNVRANLNQIDSVVL